MNIVYHNSIQGMKELSHLTRIPFSEIIRLLENTTFCVWVVNSKMPMRQVIDLADKPCVLFFCT